MPLVWLKAVHFRKCCSQLISNLLFEENNMRKIISVLTACARADSENVLKNLCSLDDLDNDIMGA